MPPAAPQVNVPEQATLVGDQTGTPYLRVGDNPNGQEMLTVTPPGGRMASIRRKDGPVPMATGGYATVGPDDELERLRKRNIAASLGEARGVAAAGQNMTDKGNVALAQTLRNSTDYQYGQAGVATPTAVIRPIGARGDLPAGTREAYQTQEQRLSAQSNQNANIRSLEYQQAAANLDGSSGVGGTRGAPQGVGKVSRGPATLAESGMETPEHLRGGSLPTALSPAERRKDQLTKQALATGRSDLVWDEEGAGGQGEYIPASEARIRAAERGVTFDPTTNTIRTKGEVMQESANKVTYQDPYTGESRYMTPHEANLAGETYKEALKAALTEEEQVPEFGNISPEKLLSLVRNGTLAEPEQIEVVAEALRFHDYDDAEIGVLLKDAQREPAPTVKTFTPSELAYQVDNYGMSEAEAVKRIEEMGYSPEEAKTKLRIERDKAKEDPFEAILREIKEVRGVSP